MQSFPSLLDALIDRRGAGEARPAIEAGALTLSRGQLAAAVHSAADQLDKLGLQRGQAVAVCAADLNQLVGLLAVNLAGGVAVSVDPNAGRIRAQAAFDALKPQIVLGAPPVDTEPGCPGYDLEWHTGAVLIAGAGGPSPVPREHVDPALAGTVVRMTSGSTGIPKPVVLGVDQLLAAAENLRHATGLDEGHRELSVGSLCHSNTWGRAAATLMAGGCLVFSAGVPLISALMEDIESRSITGLFLPPPLARLLLRADASRLAACLSRCRSIEFGSGPISVQELSKLLARLPATRLFFHYGLTECSRTTMLDLDRNPDKLHSVGQPTPGTELQIRGDDMAACRPGQEGEVLVRGPQLCHGYLGNGAVDPAREPGGFFATGDIGTLDSEGFLAIAGRRDDAINNAGNRFHPAEAEAMLAGLPGVREIVIAGVEQPDRSQGMVPWAFVVIDDTKTAPAPQQILAAARSRVPNYMAPHRVVPVAEIPVTGSGKVDRRALLIAHGAGQ